MLCQSRRGSSPNGAAGYINPKWIIFCPPSYALYWLLFSDNTDCSFCGERKLERLDFPTPAPANAIDTQGDQSEAHVWVRLCCDGSGGWTALFFIKPVLTHFRSNNETLNNTDRVI